jgi:hypothetical protein
MLADLLADLLADHGSRWRTARDRGSQLHLTWLAQSEAITLIKRNQQFSNGRSTYLSTLEGCEGELACIRQTYMQ